MMSDHGLLITGLDDPRAFLDELARRDFTAFLVRVFPHLNGGARLKTNWHIDALAYQLERIAAGKCRRLIVNLPPRNLKSIAISVAFVAWCLGHDPTRNFVCVSYSNDLAAKHARDCRAIMQSDWYLRMFPATRLSSRTASTDFETTAGGGRLATSITGTLTGRGGDIIIIDDPIKPDEAMSDTVREGVNGWFTSTLDSRLDNKSSGAILIVMQRLHPFDLSGVQAETGQWDVLSLPAIAIEDVNIPLTRGRTYHRRTGEALHEGRETLADLQRVKASIGSLVFAAQYQQQPVPLEGNMVRANWLQRYSVEPTKASKGGQIVQSWDTATEEGISNDFSVGVTALVTPRREVFVLDVFRRRMEFPVLKRRVIERAKAYHADVLLVEKKASGHQLLQQLRHEAPPGVAIPIARKPEGDKKSRLAGVSAMIEAGQLYLPQDAPWLADFLSELIAFPAVRHDDQVDALAQLLNWVGQNIGDHCRVPVGPVLFVDGEPYCGDPWLMELFSR